MDLQYFGGEESTPGVNKMKVQKCWKWTYNILVGGGVNEIKVQKCWKWTCNILMEGGEGVPSFWFKMGISVVYMHNIIFRQNGKFYLVNLEQFDSYLHLYIISLALLLTSDVTAHRLPTRLRFQTEAPAHRGTARGPQLHGYQ